MRKDVLINDRNYPILNYYGCIISNPDKVGVKLTVGSDGNKIINNKLNNITKKPGASFVLVAKVALDGLGCYRERT